METKKGNTTRTTGHTVGKPLSTHGLSPSQVIGVCKLLDNYKVIDTAYFNNRQERQAIFKLWTRKYSYRKKAIIKIQLEYT